LVNANQYLVGSSISVERMTQTSVPMPKLTRRGIQKTRATRSFGSVSFNVQGNAGIGGELTVTRSVASGGSVSAKDGCNSEALAGADRLAFEAQVPASAAGFIANGVAIAYTQAYSAMEQILGYGMGTEAGQAMAGVAFPSSKHGYNVDPAHWKLRETRWQFLLGHGTPWEESAVPHDILGETYPYPGKDAYQQKTFRTVTPAGRIVDRALSEYFVNVPD